MGATRRQVLGVGLAGLAGCVGSPRRRSERSTIDRSGDTHIGFVGDVMLGRGVTERRADDDPPGVWGSTLDRLQSLDGLVLNLECAITDSNERWPGKTYYFRADPAFAREALASVDASVAALANNHILDFGEAGLVDTKAHLDEVGVDHAGAGGDRHAALRPAITKMSGLRSRRSRLPIAGRNSVPGRTVRERPTRRSIPPSRRRGPWSSPRSSGPTGTIRTS